MGPPSAAGRRPGHWEGLLRPPETPRCPSGLKAKHCPRLQGVLAPWLSHSSLCLRACGNQLLSPGSVRFWLGPLPLPPSLTSALHGMQTRSEAGSMGLAFIQSALLRAHWVPGSVPALRAKCYQCIEARPPVFLLCLPFGPLGALCHEWVDARMGSQHSQRSHRTHLSGTRLWRAAPAPSRLLIRAAVSSGLGCALHQVPHPRGCRLHCGHFYCLKNTLDLCDSLTDAAGGLLTHRGRQFCDRWRQRDSPNKISVTHS